MEAFQQELTDRYAELYREAFTPFTSLSQEALRLRCLAIVGAAEAIAREMNRGRIDDRTASAALHSLIRSWLAWGGLSLFLQEFPGLRPARCRHRSVVDLKRVRWVKRV